MHGEMANVPRDHKPEAEVEAERQVEEEMEASSATVLCSRLIHHCRVLLAEIDVFQHAVASRFRRHQQQQHLVEMRLLRSNVASELKALQRLEIDTRALVEERARMSQSHSKHIECTPHGDGVDSQTELEMKEARIIHTLRSSNLSFLTAVWTIAKERCQGIVGFSKRFYWGDEDGDGAAPDNRAKGNRQGKPPNKDKKKSAFVDIVYGNGEDWLKVSTINESRLLMEMAEKGWGLDDDDDDDDDDDNSNGANIHADEAAARKIPPSDDEAEDEDQLDIITMALDLVRAARATRVRYKNPRVRIVVPKLAEGKVPQIDSVLRTIRSYGVEIECGMSLRDIFIPDETYENRDPTTINEDDLPLSQMLPNPFQNFTKAINIDCTLLLALVSDLSHFQSIAPSPNFHRAIIRQIEIEDELPLLTTELWPALAGRQLVCTREATERMKDIVNTLGTDSERRRTSILLGEDDMQGLDKDTLLRECRKLSDHSIPDTLNLPVQQVDAHPEIEAALKANKLPPVVHKVSEILTDINRSVFLYGWARDIVTISSNRAVVKHIESVVEASRGNDDKLEGPRVWICDTARSLIGKEKNRKS